MSKRSFNKILVVGHSTSPFAPAIVRGFNSLGYITNYFDHFKPNLQTQIFGAIKNIDLLPKDIINNKITEIINDSLIKRAIKLGSDLVFLFKAKNISADSIKTLRKLGICVVNWYPDYYDDWEWIKKHAAGYDYFFTPCLYIQKKLSEIGIRSFYIPFAAEVDSQFYNLDKKYQVTFVGRYTKRRNILYKQLLKENILDIWGYSHWKNSIYKNKYHGQVSAETSKSIIRQSAITINTLTATDDVPIESINYRVFEATGVGGFVLTWYKYPLEECFSLGKEIEIFRSGEEALEKAKFYLSHDNVREKIARAGWKRTLTYHTYKIRIKQMLSFIK